MKSLVKPVSFAIAALCLVLGAATGSLAQTPAASGPTARDFGREPAINGVSVSPDGKHIAALIAPDGDERLIAVWDTSDFSKKPTILGSQKMRLLGVRFLKNDRLLVDAIQTFTLGYQKSHLGKQWVTDLNGEKWSPLLPSAGVRSPEAEQTLNGIRDSQLIDVLPRDPSNVLVLDQRVATEGDIYKVDVYTGRAARVDRASDRFFDPQSDLKGDIRAKQTVDFDKGAIYIAQFLRNPDTGVFEEHFRSYGKDRQPFSVVGFDTDPNIAFVATNRGQDKIGIFEYDIRAKKILEPLFGHRLWDAGGVITSRAEADYGRILGFTYTAESRKVFWTDPAMKAAAEQLNQALGGKTSKVSWADPATNQRTSIDVVDGVEVNIAAWSYDRQTMVVERSGPKQPPEYYVLKDGKANLLGRSRPWIDVKAVGDVALVQYPARDGLMIPGILTTPPKDKFGPGPYPTLIEPHGGPWSRDSMDWDITGWTQYFASKGYAVLQPQFRGSDGWGQKLWRAGDGQWGQAMQDDKDDGAKWLIAQKIAAPDRIAMFGYSYGGYAALAAAIRPNGLYQCAISGAGAGDLASIQQSTNDNRFLREFQRPAIDGLDALDHAGQAQIPLFIYHGDRDQTVKLRQSEAFVAKLKAAGKPYRYLEMKDMGHQIVTWGPKDGETQLVEVEKFLNTECGPGGI